MLQLAELLAPIADDAAAAERVFRDELISDQGFISDLCGHIAQFHGKRLRPALLLLSAKACGGVRPEHHTLAAVVEMVHIATLVHDDVLDEADIRRRAATVNRLWGNERAVLMGDFLISHAFHLCSSLDSQRGSRLIGAATNAVCEGEMMQVADRYHYDIDEERYLDIITRKTAVLIGVCGELGAAFAGADEQTVRDMRRFGESLGVAFQITDDLLDLLGDEAEVGKTLGRDLEEGKLTLPLIHCLRQSSRHAAELRELLESAADGRDRRIVHLLHASDSLQYARRVAAEYIGAARDVLEALPPSDARDSLMAMTEFVGARRL